MILPSIFGTDGVRGVANRELTPELALKLGLAGGRYLLDKQINPGRGKVFIGRDTRLSGDMLESALVAGLTAAGLDVHLGGILPTPAVAYLTRTEDFSGGIMISASHNPIADNGIKFFNADGNKLTDKEEDQIETYLENGEKYVRPEGEEVGKKREAFQLKEKYLNFLCSKANGDFTGYKVVLDTAYGAAWEIAPRVWERLGADVISLNDSPAGEKINHQCGSTYPQVIREIILEAGADFGFAFDGDADRVIAIDEKGNELDGDFIMAICGCHLLKIGRLANRTLVATKYSNQGLKEALQKEGGELLLTQNGDRYVFEALKGKKLNLGGEKSGHIIFFEENTTGDGLLTSIMLANVISSEHRKLSQLAKVMKPWPQLLRNVEVKDKGWKDNLKIQEVIKRSEKTLGDRGRLLVRASGTEPVIRVMVEGKDENILGKILNDVVGVIEKELC